jgi:two-component system chemotaxis sensor kinase CheA
MPVDTMAAIKQTFFQECQEQLGELEAGLLAMESGDADQETVNAVFRAVHSIKGGAGAFSLDDLVGFAHVFETTLDHVRDGRLTPTAAILKTMLRAADVLADLLQAAREGTAFDAARSAALADELAALTGATPAPAGVETTESGDGFGDIGFTPVPVADLFFDAAAAPVPGSTKYLISFKPLPALYGKANETAVLLREVSRLGPTKVSCDATGLPLLHELDPQEAYLAWNIELETADGEAAIREVFEFVDGDCDLDIKVEGAAALPAPGGLTLSLGGDVPPLPGGLTLSLGGDAAPPAGDPATAGAESLLAEAARADARAGVPAIPTTIRVDLDRIDRLVDLAGELVINQAMLAERVNESGLAGTSAVASGLDELEQLTREIQESVMAIRAQPVKSVFQRMPRLVREVASMTGKSVRLVMEGEGTEVDTTVIERLADPLTHMIRNAIDHGLEPPEKRVAAAKPQDGEVRLSAMHRSGRIVIEVADDGAGIDRPRVKAIAAKKKLIAEDATLSNEEIDNLIFLPGFSTAATVSNISGRGVGMDVVRRSVQALGGRLSIASRPGQGSTFTMSLPLTLAVLEGMVVTVAGQTVVVPMTAVVESLQPKKDDVRDFGKDAKVIAIRNDFVPVIDVGYQLGYRNEIADPTGGVALLVESERGERSALTVDAIQGQRQVVIKSLEANYGHIPGIAAATILGDGRVALILDVDGVLSVSRSGAARSEPVRKAG